MSSSVDARRRARVARAYVLTAKSALMSAPPGIPGKNEVPATLHVRERHRRRSTGTADGAGARLCDGVPMSPPTASSGHAKGSLRRRAMDELRKWSCWRRARCRKGSPTATSPRACCSTPCATRLVRSGSPTGGPVPEYSRVS